LYVETLLAPDGPYSQDRMTTDSLFRKAFWSLAACGLIYALAMGAMTLPIVQRNVAYVHNINPTFYQDLNNTEQFGFIHHQIQPFTVTTPDNVTLFAWHLLPTHLYNEHEQELKNQPEFGLQPWDVASKSVGLQLLLNDPNANVVVAFHGNAAHLASNYRPTAYQQILGVSTSTKPVHVIAFDYRGFGLSTGTPTEEGVIQDGISMLSALTGQAPGPSKPTTSSLKRYLDPSQIIVTGQSMGTFISTATYHCWTLTHNLPPFKALILIASFTNLPNLLETYSFKGLTPPILSPLMYYPKIQNYLRSTIVDQWDASSRLVEMVKSEETRLNLVMLHARNDFEIPWEEGRANWDRVLEAAKGDMPAGINDTPSIDEVASEGRAEKGGKVGVVRDLDNESFESRDGKKRLRWERVRHGGHNRIQTSEQVRLAVLRVVEGD
jgi:alpha-beta hydrolase superfamily lysophospholipase